MASFASEAFIAQVSMSDSSFSRDDFSQAPATGMSSTYKLPRGSVATHRRSSLEPPFQLAPRDVPDYGISGETRREIVPGKRHRHSLCKSRLEFAIASTRSAAPRMHRASAKMDGLHASPMNGFESESISPTGPRRGAFDKSDPSHAEGGETNEIERPPWSDMKTKAGKERKRLPLACIACRRKKIRCSGEQPACKHCQHSRVPCVYKVTARKATPRTDYMTMLDKRLRRMEDRVIKIIPYPVPGKLDMIGRAIVKPATRIVGNESKKRTADEAFEIDELEGWAQSGKNAHFKQQGRREEEEKDSTLEGIENLPSVDLQEHLAEVFFQYIYGQSYHLLHKPSFMRKLRAGTVPPVLILAVCAVAARFSNHPQVNTEPAFLRGEIWALPARRMVMQRYDEPNLTILTVLLLLGLHEFGTCQGGRSWMLGGMALRMAYALQLHRELDHDPLGQQRNPSPELSITDKEIRRRTMWACFLMDRLSSSGTERPAFASEDSIQVQLPIHEAHFHMELPGRTERLHDSGASIDEDPAVGHTSQLEAGPRGLPAANNMGVEAYLVRILALWGRVIQYLNLGGKETDPHPLWHSQSQFRRLENDADDFVASLPDRLKYTKETLQNHALSKLANQFLFLHMCYHQVVLFLHQFAIPSARWPKLPRKMPQAFVSDAARRAVEAAIQISNLIRDAAHHPLTAPFAGYCAFASGAVHIWGMFSQNPRLGSSSKRNLEDNVRFLGKMQRHWGMLHYMVENLKEIYQNYYEASQRGGLTTSSDASSHVFQYGDWFTKYPHGISSTDQEDPLEMTTDKTAKGVHGQSSDLQSVEEFFGQQLKSPPSHGVASTARSKRSKASSIAISHDPPEQQALNISPDYHIPMAPQLLRPQIAQPLSNLRHQPQYSTFDQPQIYSTYDLSSNSPPPTCSAPPVLEALDRQFVFSAAYTGQDAANDTTDESAQSSRDQQQHQQLHLLPQSTQQLQSYRVAPWYSGARFDDAESIAGLNTMGPIPYFDGKSSAWFTPFNLNPPDIGPGDGLEALETFDVEGLSAQLPEACRSQE